MERLGVSYFPLYHLQMILHLYMYRQSYMSTIDFKRRNRLKRKHLESWNLSARLTFYCTVVNRSFQSKKYSSSTLLTKYDMGR